MSSDTATTPCISVIVPCFNQGTYLAEAISSALHQRDADFSLELIVVNDGSTDHTQHVAEQFSTDVVLINQTNQGMCAARNAGLAIARGEWIIFLDADDVLLPGTFARFRDALKTHPEVDVIYGGAELMDASGQRMQTVLPSDLSSNSLEQLLSANRIATPGALCIQRELCRKVGPFDPGVNLAADWDYWIRSALLGASFVKINAAVVGYRQHASSNSRRYFDLLTDVGRVGAKHRGAARRSWALWFAWVCGQRSMRYFCWSKILYPRIRDAWRAGRKREAASLFCRAAFHNLTSAWFVFVELLPLSLLARCHPTVSVTSPQPAPPS